MNDYTTRIAGLLKERGMSWATVSRATGISEGTLSHCRKVNKYTTEQIDKIAKALAMSVSELTDFEGEYQKIKGLMGSVEQLRTILNNDFS